MNTNFMLEPTYSQKIAELARLNRLTKATDNSPEARQARLDQMAYDKDQNNQLKRLLQRQNGSSANVQQDKFTGISDGILGYAQGVVSDRANPPLSQPVTAYGVGSATGDAVNSAGRALYDAAGNIIPPVLDTYADAVEGGTNFLRGAVGMDEMEEGKRFRKGNDFNPFNYKGILGIEQDSTQADLSALARYRPDGILANAQDIDMGGKGVLRTDEPNTHTMPDGTVMEGATHEEYEQANPPTNLVLDPVGTTIEPAPVEERPFNKNGILQGIGDSLVEDDGTGSATNNSRSHTATAEEIKAKKEADDRRNEMLIRVGGAIVGASGQGGLAAIGAGTKEYGRLADYQRAQEQLEKENALARGRATATSSKAQAKAQEDLNSQIQSNTQKANHFDYLIDRIKQEGDNLTGLYDGTGQAAYDSMTGHPRAALRLEMSQARVDAALKNVAETKGAISNREMTLFLSPMPKLGVDQESVWIAWLEMQSGLTKVLNTRLKGEQLSDGTLASKIKDNQKLDSDLQALYQSYLNAQSSQSKVSDDNDELFNF